MVQLLVFHARISTWVKVVLIPITFALPRGARTAVVQKKWTAARSAPSGLPTPGPRRLLSVREELL